MQKKNCMSKNVKEHFGACSSHGVVAKGNNILNVQTCSADTTTTL